MRPFGEWLPDVNDLNIDSLDIARNVLPGVNSYLPAPGLIAQSIEALPLPAKGLWSVQTSVGTFDLYVATAAKLYKYNADTFSFADVSRLVGGDYNLFEEDYWTGTQFGNRLIVCQLGDPPQFIDVDSGANFANLPNAPTARFVTVMDDHVVFSALFTDQTSIKWSALNDSENYTSGTAGNQEFPDAGKVMGVYPHARVVLLQRGMRGVVPTGDKYAFNFPEITFQRGTLSPWSVIEFGSIIYWLSSNGFHVGNAEQQKDISEKRISANFFDTFNTSRITQVFGTYDPYVTRVYWAYPSGDTEYNDRILVYDWALDRWSELAVDTYILMRSATASVSLDGGSDSEDMDDPSLPSLDSTLYMSGAPVLIAFGTDLKLSTFEGPNMAATLETGSYQFGGGRRVRLRAVLPYFEENRALLANGSIAPTSAITVTVSKRQRYGDPWNTSSSIPQQRSGTYRMNADGAYHKLLFTIPAGTDFKHAQGWEPDFIPTTSR